MNRSIESEIDKGVTEVAVDDDIRRLGGTEKGKISKGQSPYLDARREWNAQFGRIASNSRMWALVALFTSIAAAVSTVGLVTLGARTKVIPHVFVMDSSGRVLDSGLAISHESNTADARVVQAMISRFITNLRTVTSDGAANKRAVTEIYAMLSSSDSAYQVVSDYFRGPGDPFEIAKARTVSVEIAAILPMSDKTYQVEWREIVRERRGALISDHVFQSIVTVRRATNESDRNLMANPIGLFVTEISWTRKI